jgi:hypothetical protein
MVHPPSSTILTQRMGYRLSDVVGVGRPEVVGISQPSKIAQLKYGRIGTVFNLQAIDAESPATVAAVARNVPDGEARGVQA